MRTALAAFTLLLVVLAAAPAHAADPAFRATVSPERVVFGEVDRLTYRVEVTTGEEAERFSLSAAPFAAPGGVVLLFPTTEGMRLEGEGTLRSGVSTHGDSFPCRHETSDLRRGHGFGQYTQDYDVSVPARTTSTVVFAALVPRDAPWPDDRFSMRIRATDGVSEGEGTLESAIDIPVAAPAPGGRTGVRIALATDTPSTRGCDVPENQGRPITLSGRTDAELAGQEIVLRVVPPGTRAAQDLTTVRIGGDGSFAAAPWRPKALGIYQVAAVYRSQDARRTDDFTAPLAFRLTAPVPDPPVTPGPPAPPDPPGPIVEFVPGPPQIINRSLRVDRRGLVRLRLSCPADARVDCAAPVRLRIGRRTAASRDRITVLRGTRRTIRVRLSRPARRLVNRRGGVRATVSIGDRPLVAVTLRPRR